MATYFLTHFACDFLSTASIPDSYPSLQHDPPHVFYTQSEQAVNRIGNKQAKGAEDPYGACSQAHPRHQMLTSKQTFLCNVESYGCQL